MAEWIVTREVPARERVIDHDYVRRLPRVCTGNITSRQKRDAHRLEVPRSNYVILSRRLGFFRGGRGAPGDKGVAEVTPRQRQVRNPTGRKAARCSCRTVQDLRKHLGHLFIVRILDPQKCY